MRFPPPFLAAPPNDINIAKYGEHLKQGVSHWLYPLKTVKMKLSYLPASPVSKFTLQLPGVAEGKIYKNSFAVKTALERMTSMFGHRFSS